MIRTSAVEGSTRVEVIFTLPGDRVGDTAVSLVGDFNGWDPRPHPLRVCEDGTDLVARVTLKAGERYAFRYLTRDGHWFNDDGAHGYQRNGMGTENSILDLTDFCSSTPAPARDDHRGAERRQIVEPSAPIQLIPRAPAAKRPDDGIVIFDAVPSPTEAADRISGMLPA